MNFIVYIFYFLLGSAVGSFLGVVTDRSQTGESILKGRSHCDHCKRKLHWRDLIPLLSFAMLRGRCRYCHKKLSIFYPIIEVTTGLLFVLTVLALGSPFAEGFGGTQQVTYIFEVAYYLFILSSLITIFFVDLKYGIIPFKIVASAVFVTFVYLLLTSYFLLLTSFLSALGAFVFFLLIFFGTLLITKKEGMGFGDVVYAFLMGFLLGFPRIILGLYIAFIVGAIVALLLVALKKKQFKGGSVPFGPFLVLGTIVSMFWGDAIIAIVLNLLRG